MLNLHLSLRRWQKCLMIKYSSQIFVANASSQGILETGTHSSQSLDGNIHNMGMWSGIVMSSSVCEKGQYRSNKMWMHALAFTDRFTASWMLERPVGLRSSMLSSSLWFLNSSSAAGHISLQRKAKSSIIERERDNVLDEGRATSSDACCTEHTNLWRLLCQGETHGHTVQT